MFYLFFLIFLFGLFVGSFLNCIIYRLKKEKSFLKGRSMCPFCGHKLGFFDLIPVFSFLFLKGKCRYCQKKISWQYPLVELAVGFLFVLSFYFYFNSIFLFYLLIIISFLIIIFVYDLRYFIIPDKVLFPAIIISLAYRLFEIVYLKLNWNILLYYLLAVIAASGFFLLIYCISKGKWIGFGDVKLGILLGLIAGWPDIILLLFLSYLIGGIIGIGLICFKKKKLENEVPFGPFLILGTFLTIFFGDKLINWYLGLLQ